MKDYARIMAKIKDTPWLITPNALATIVDIVDKHINGNPPAYQASPVAGFEEGTATASNGVGILGLRGPIFDKANLMTQMSGATDLEVFSAELSAMVQNDMIHTIIMDVDSPGGTSDMVEETSSMIKAAADVKPIYAIANSQMGSAALWLGSQATKLYSTPSGMVGSIGVYTVHEDRSANDAQQGKKYTYIFAGPNKTEGNPNEPLSAEALAYRQEVVDELYDKFVNAVAEGRGADPQTVESTYGGGRMLTANKALEVGMVDGITTLNQLVISAQKPQQVSIQLDGKQIAAYQIGGNIYSAVGYSNRSSSLLESKEWEHSEPGSGPAPRTDEDGSDDPAIKSGSRRDPLPLPKGSPGAPGTPEASANNNHNEGGENQLNSDDVTTLCELFDTDEENLVEVAQAVVSELGEFQTGAGQTTEEVLFATQFPDVWKEHQKLLATNRKNSADNFADSVSKCKRAVGDDFVVSSTGLSAVAIEAVSEAHEKFAMAGLAEPFEDAVKAIVNGGLVDYSEHGTSTEGETPSFDTTTAQGIQNARILFDAKIKEIQAANDGMTYETATAEAVRKFPDLAAAYRVALPA